MDKRKMLQDIRSIANDYVIPIEKKHELLKSKKQKYGQRMQVIKMKVLEESLNDTQVEVLTKERNDLGTLMFHINQILKDINKKLKKGSVAFYQKRVEAFIEIVKERHGYDEFISMRKEGKANAEKEIE